MIQETQSKALNQPVAKPATAMKRVGYVDIAKGIGIILVVMGHNDFALISPFAHKLIYSFHMPMFFFMSGIFFKPDIPFWMFARQRFNRVLRPFLFMILFIFFTSISFSKVSILEASRRLVKAMYGSGQYLDWVQLWFLPHLFVVSLFAYLFVRTIRQPLLVRMRWVILIVLYVIGVFSISLFYPFELNLLGKEFMLYGLPFSLDLVLVSGFFFILAYELNQIRYASFLESPWTLLIVALMLIFLVWYFPAKIDFNLRWFDSLPINTIEALLGILLILAISKQMERIGWLSYLFNYLGQASLIILIFQVPIQDYWGQKLLMLTNNLSFSYWLSFLAGVLGPVVINALFIHPNPILKDWFGQAKTRENASVKVSVFE
jgi:fucose 4-O-acetylase-like acetyltransferase